MKEDKQALGVARIIESAHADGRRSLYDYESLILLENWGVPVAKTAVARTVEEAMEIAGKIGYPVVLKVISPQVIHKSDVKGVKLNIKSPEEVAEAYKSLIREVQKRVPEAIIKGVTVQKYHPNGVEVIVGALRDQQFGPVIMFGLGGIFTEIYDDVSLRVLPVNEAEIEEMIMEVRCSPLLSGYRGGKPADIESLKRVILDVSSLIMEIEEIIEMDLNPVKVFPKGAIVVDARMILR